MEVNFWWARTPAWGRPYIPLQISKNTHPSGVTKSSRLYMLMNCFGIFEMWMRTYSGSSKSVFRYMFIKSNPAHFALGVDNLLLMRILAVERSAVGVLTSYSTVIFAASDRDADPMGIWFLRTEVGDHSAVCGSLVRRYVASMDYEHSVRSLDVHVTLQ